MTKSMHAHKGMFSLGFLKGIVQVSILLVLLFISSPAFALICGDHDTTNTGPNPCIFSSSDDHQHENTCCRSETSQDGTLTNPERTSKEFITPATYPFRLFHVTLNRFSEKNITRIRDHVSGYTTFQLRGVVIFNS